MNNFDLFRLNCFLNDIQANDYKTIIISLVTEFIFDNNNKDQSLEQCYKHVVEYHKLDIEKDFFSDLITNSRNFDKKAIQNDILLKLTSEKFNKLHKDIHEHNIDHHILQFLKSNNYSEELLVPIKSLIYRAVYDNINTFSTENLNSLISENLKENFSNEEIAVFNEFLDYDDYKKNSALYNIFLKATEFAIVTSGKGVKNLSKDIFKGKKYFLDTNIILRLIGIGGIERKETLIKLLKSCIHQGIIFEFTGQTYQEFQRTLSSNVKYLKFAETKFDIKKLGELTESEGQLINDDFITHYSKEKLQGNINNPEQYELQMLAKFRKLQEKLPVFISKDKISINQKETDKLSNYLHREKKLLPYGRNYSKTAANIDAYNILVVRNLRGNNDYNYIDVKSFYLTTDRTLNQILSKENLEDTIPETILPSQLFILHHPYMSNGEEVDYDLFLQFVKRRTSEHSFKGGEVLSYINEIRKKTTSDEEMKYILNVYADKRYIIAKNDENHKVRTIIPIKEVIETVIDKKLAEGKIASDNLKTIHDNAIKQISNFHKNSRNIIRFIDLLLTISIIPLSVLLLKQITSNPYYLIAGTLLLEIIKFSITSKTRLWNTIWKRILEYFLRNSNYFQLTKDTNYIKEGFLRYDKVDGEIWKREK